MQSKLQELDIPSIGLYRTTTPSSRDSGIPIPSPTSSFSCLSASDEATSPKSVLEFFLHPPRNETSTPMTSMYNSTPRYQSHGRNVHWNDESVIPSQKDTKSNISTVVKNGQRISLSASLPFHTKLNIRIHANRVHPNETNQVKAVASIQPLDPKREHEFTEALRQTYFQHYSTLSPNERVSKNTRIHSPIRYEKLPRQHLISLPVSLPVDQRLFIYIRNGEVFARL